MEEFVVTLEESQYPIDVLLFLVKEKKIDIRFVNLADIADDFMNFVSQMTFVDLELMSEFVALASDLIKIKSFSLIPSKRKYVRSMEERIKTSLEEREKLLQKAREIVDFAKFMETVKIVKIGDKGKTTTKPIVHETLYRAFNNAKKRIDFREKLKYISSGKFSVSDSISKLKTILSDIDKIEFISFLSKKERLEKITYIIAMLEIVKEDFARIEQNENEVMLLKN